MSRNMDTAAIYQLQGGNEISKLTFVPVMETDDKSRELAFQWAASLVSLSGKTVTIYRNGTWMIDLPAQQ